MEWVWVFLVAETVLVVALLDRVRGRSQGVEDRLRDELTRRYDAALKEIRELRDEVDRLWDARTEDRTFINELEDYITRLVTVMTEHKINPIPPRPVRRRVTREDMSDRDEVKMRRLLVDRLQVGEFKTLAFDLGLGELTGETTSELARALLDLVRTRRKWADLTKWLADNRPDIQL